MSFIHQYPPLQSLLAAADYMDMKYVDVKHPTSEAALREFVAGFLSYYPEWIKMLYRVRWGFVRLLGMRQAGIPSALILHASDIPMEAGAKLSFFTVTDAAEGRHWIANVRESHLTASFAAVVEPLGEEISRIHGLTVVQYNSWAGPLYFNVIRPFHHLVVARMMPAGARQVSSAGGKAVHHANS